MANTRQEEVAMLEKAHQVLHEDEAMGANVYNFDPDASPTQKAGVAVRAAQEKLAPMKGFDGSTGTNLVEGLVNAATPSNFNIPSIVVEDSDEKTPVGPTTTVDGKEEPPKEPAPPRYEIPDWYVVGWRQMAGVDKPPLPEGEEKDSSILDTFLSEQFYIAWYNNAGVIVFAILASYILTWIGFGWGWLLVILGVCYTQYTTSVARFQRNARDDIVRELVKTRLAENKPETVEWLNGFLERFWIIYEPIMSGTILSTVDMILSYSTPAFLDSIRMSEFSLGNKAPRVDKVWTTSQVEPDIVQMEWDISFTPTDIVDMTQRQLDKKLNPKILLIVRLGKGIATASLPVLVEDVSLTGRIQIRLKLAEAFPYVQIVDFCFMEQPVINYALKPVGGETFGFDISNIPGLSAFIRDTLHSILGPMMYHPCMYRLNLEQMMSGRPLESAVGVVEVLVHSARGIKGSSLTDSTPDPYVALAIDQKPEVARTKWKGNTHNPTWMEVKHVLVTKLVGKLNLNVYDYNQRLQHQKLSSTSFDLSLLKDDSVHEGIVSKLFDGDKERGELRYDVNFYPVVEAATPPIPSTTPESADSSIGIVRLVIHQAKELDPSSSVTGALSPYANVYLSNSRKLSFRTVTYKHTDKPIWEAPYEFLCSHKDTDVVTIKVFNDRDFRRNPVVGYMSIRVQDLLNCKAQGTTWFTLHGCKYGNLKVSATWKPVAMSGSVHGTGQYVSPIGVVRLWVQKATNVKNVDIGLAGKSDPYIRVQISNETKGKTEVKDDNLNPVWDEIMYVPVRSLRESIMLDCLDEQTMCKDRPLGSVELHVSDLAKKTDDPYFPYESSGTKVGADTLRLEKGDTKGTLHYQATFVPAWRMDVKFNKDSHAYGASLEMERSDDEGGEVIEDDDSEDDSPIPVGLTFKSRRNGLPKINTGVAGSVSAAVTPVTPTAVLSAADTILPQIPDALVATAPQHSVDELLSQQSGIVVFNVISGQLAEKGRIEVVLDDLEWPCVSTPKSRSTTARWEFVGEGFIKEIDFGQVHLFLDEAQEEGKDCVVAEWSGSIKDFLRDTLEGPKEYVLVDKRGRKESKVLIEARYIPVPIILEARESVSNQGVLTVDLIDGQDILAVDKGATRSDPYVVFTLNGEKVHKSETHKKTLAPVWNESFDVNITSRASSELKIEVFDWNRVEQDQTLGMGVIDLQRLEAFQSVERIITLSTTKQGQKGQIRLHLLFTPFFIAKARKNTSTFSNVAMTQIGGFPVNAGKGIVQGVAGVFRR